MTFTANWQEYEDTGKIEGVVIGIVTNNNDEEKLGRVKVKFPHKKDEDQTDWIRVATLMAGNGRGTFFLARSKR